MCAALNTTLIQKATHLPYNPELIEQAQAFRRCMPLPEKKLWFQFLKGQPDRFTRQKAIAHYIVDFYSAQLKLVIELDGNSHFEAGAQSRDGRRTAALEEYGLRVIRFNNTEILKQFPAVCEKLMGLFEELRG